MASVVGLMHRLAQFRAVRYVRANGGLGSGVIALSWANLAMIRVWDRLLYSEPDLFFMRSAPGMSDYLSAVLALILLTALIWSASIGVRHRHSAPVRIPSVAVLCMMTVVSVNELRGCLRVYMTSIGATSLMHDSSITWLAGGGFAVFVLAGWRNPKSWGLILLRVCSVLLLVTVPFTAFTLSSSLWNAVQAERRNLTDKRPARSYRKQTGRGLRSPRVLWIIFDGWDSSLTFEARPAGLSLPEVDRFSAAAIRAAHAVAPATRTIESVPSLLTGRVVEKATPIGPDELTVRFNDPPPLRLGRYPHLFDEIHREGLRAAVVGWYLPYCRLFGESLVTCDWWPAPSDRDDYVATSITGKTTMTLSRLVFPAGLRSTLTGISQGTSTQIENYKAMMKRGKVLASDKSMDLVFLHLPPPHAPFIYDRRTGRLSTNSHSYLDGLALVDRTIGEFRRAMEESGDWETTTVLLSSDHGYRGIDLDHSNPWSPSFLLKLAGQKHGTVYSGPFHTVLTHDLLLAVIHGDLSTPEQVVTWLEADRLTPTGSPPLRPTPNLAEPSAKAVSPR